MSISAWNTLNEAIVGCRDCPRLTEYRERIGREKRKAFLDWEYWARPVPNFGDARGRLLIVGLAPAAHGANRTGRMFTGDRSGDWLYRALCKAGFANQPTSVDRSDGLKLSDCAITAACHCAPPDNKPTLEEFRTRQQWFARTFDLTQATVFLALGQLAWRAILDEARRREWHTGRLPKFAHGAQAPLAGHRWLLGSYHPSQQNTFTGVLTEPMLDAVFATAKELIQA